jgi:hypothetical protein
MRLQKDEKNYTKLTDKNKEKNKSIGFVKSQGTIC